MRLYVLGLILALTGCGSVPTPEGPISRTIPSAPPAPAATNVPAQTAELLLFGGRDHKVFLGCLNCGKYDSGSIWNRYGDHGSRYSDTSIWNKYGTYGSKYNDESPWNRYGQSPPVIVDRAGNFYGYFTANPYFQNRTTLKSALAIIERHEYIMENLDEVVNGLR